MNKELKILLLSSVLFTLAGGMFGPIYAIFVEGIGGDLLTAGAAYSIFAIVSGILIFFISRWEDHVKKQEILVVCGYALNCIGFFGYLITKNPLDLFIVQIIFGAGCAIKSPAYDGLYSKHLEKGKFVSEWGLWESIYMITTGLAAIAGGIIGNFYGFRMLFIIMLFSSIIGFIVSIDLLIRKRKSGKL